MNTRQILAKLSIIVLSAFILALFPHPGHSEPSHMQTVRLNIAPLPLKSDPGPALLLGAEIQPGGYKYVSMDIALDGPGDFRAYFDYRDNDTYHFVDRAGTKVALGLREAGSEQVLAEGVLEGKGALRLARHGCKMGLFEGSRLCAFAFDDRLVEGAVGLRMLDGTAAIKIKADARDDIHFADDFMISQGKSEQWHGNGDPKRGDFAVKSLRHPLLSANAFSFFGVGSGVYSVTGETWWDNYVYDASMRGPVAGTIGLVFAFQDDKNYGLFRWGSRGAEASKPAHRELVRVRNGAEEVIAQAPGGYNPDEWYKATVNVSYSHVSVSMDNHILLEASDPCLTAGAAGVWCDVALPAKLAKDPKEQDFTVNSLEEMMRQHAVFDDVRIHSQEDYEQHFNLPGALSGGWMAGEGDWSVKAGSPDGKTPPALLVSTAGISKALIGDRRWSRYQVTAELQPLNGGAAGIVLMHRDESNYYAVKIEAGALKLIRVAAGIERVEDSAPLAATDGFIRVQATVKQGHIKASTDDGATVETFDGETRMRGRGGLLAASTKGNAVPCARFASVAISFIPEPEPLVTTNAIFDEEVSMNEWSNGSSEWVPPAEIFMIENKPANLLWHRSQFPGDVELMVEPRDITESSYQFGLACAKDGQTKNNGYIFKYRVTGDEKTGSLPKVEIVRQGEVVKSAVLNADVRQLSSLAVRRSGKYVIGLVNGRSVLAFRDENPLKGSKVAFYTQGVLVKTEAVRISSEHFHSDTFSGAPINWRSAGAAIAEVTNRWQCDPRWSFFSLYNDRAKGKPAVLWSKQLYPGDVAVEFYFGNKMDSSRGTPYSYVRDVNVTIGSDGSDLRKGYTFSFGGHENTCCYIMRDGVEVKRIPVRMPTTMDYHRHWYTFKAERQGNNVKFRVDQFFQTGNNKGFELVFEDSQPLQGDRVAIWTYDNGIMISKARISGDGGDTSESPDFVPGPIKTVYDK